MSGIFGLWWDLLGSKGIRQPHRSRDTALGTHNFSESSTPWMQFSLAGVPLFWHQLYDWDFTFTALHRGDSDFSTRGLASTALLNKLWSKNSKSLNLVSLIDFTTQTRWKTMPGTASWRHSLAPGTTAVPASVHWLWDTRAHSAEAFILCLGLYAHNVDISFSISR